jgi:predicted dehydrogenase
MRIQDSIGFGIVGTGMAAELHARAILACADNGAHLVGFASRRPGLVPERASGSPCMEMEELMEHKDVDVVCICSPSGLHAEHALRAASSGKHVLVEKPMALSTNQARQMVAEFNRIGCLLGVALQRRAEPLFRRVHRAVRRGELGELVCGLVSIPYKRTMAYYESADWRGTWAMDGGGVLINQGIHLMDLLIWFLGDPQGIEARAATLRHGIEVEDTLSATLVFSGGAMATLLATTATEPGFAHRLEIYGTKGGIQIEGEEVLRWQTAGGDIAIEHQEQTSSAGAGGDPRGIPISGHIGLIENFMDAVKGKTALLVDGREGMRSVSAVESIYAAAGLNRKGRHREEA